jgi:hypothetical protein
VRYCIVEANGISLASRRWVVVVGINGEGGVRSAKFAPARMTVFLFGVR